MFWSSLATLGPCTNSAQFIVGQQTELTCLTDSLVNKDVDDAELTPVRAV